MLTDFGAMMHRRGAIRDVREQLSLGLDLAVRCRARPSRNGQDKSFWRPGRDRAGEPSPA
jgi:hypothetical protein